VIQLRTTKNDKKKDYGLWMLLIMVMAQMVEGVEMNDTILYSPNDGTAGQTVYINNTINMGNLTINATVLIIGNLQNNGTFKNLNATTDARIYFYNLTNPLIYFENLSSFCDDILNCYGIQIPSWEKLNTMYVLDKYNVNESETRENNPIWFSVSNSTAKHIISNLTDTINVTMLFTPDNCSIAEADYRSNTSAYAYIYNVTTNSSRFMCSDSNAAMNITGMETGTNYLTLVYGKVRDLDWQVATIFSLFGSGAYLIILAVHRKQKWLNIFLRIGIFSLVPMLAVTMFYVTSISVNEVVTPMMTKWYEWMVRIMVIYFYGLFILLLMGIIQGVVKWQDGIQYQRK